MNTLVPEPSSSSSQRVDDGADPQREVGLGDRFVGITYMADQGTYSVHRLRNVDRLIIDNIAVEYLVALNLQHVGPQRSEVGRVGKEWVCKCRIRGSSNTKKKNMLSIYY